MKYLPQGAVYITILREPGGQAFLILQFYTRLAPSFAAPEIQVGTPRHTRSYRPSASPL